MKSYFFVPENLDLEDLLRKEGMPVSRIILEKYFYVIDNIYVRRFTQKEADRTTFFSVSAKTQDQLLGWKHAASVRQNLIKLGILESDGQFITGYKCLGYRFTEAWHSAKFRKVPITNAKFAAKIAAHKEEESQKVLEDASLRYIHDCVRRIDIDYPAARKFCYENHVNEALESRLVTLDISHDDSFGAKVGEKGGRFFHSFLLLSRDCRQFAAYQGQPLVSLDFRCCQPALLASLYPADAEAQAEKARYAAVHQSEEGLYGFLGAFFGDEYDLNDKNQRDDFKEMLLAYFLFAKNSVPSKMRQIWEEHFPILARKIAESKANPKLEYNKALSRLLQQLEAKLVLRTIIPKLIKQYPGVPLVTIHDCIATTEEFADVVREVMIAEFEQLMGWRIEVKQERITNLDLCKTTGQQPNESNHCRKRRENSPSKRVGHSIAASKASQTPMGGCTSETACI